MDVELGRHDVFEPDLLVIMSPSTASRDRGIKRERYERAGMPEYWVVDATKNQVEVHALDPTQVW